MPPGDVNPPATPIMKAQQGEILQAKATLLGRVIPKIGSTNRTATRPLHLTMARWRVRNSFPRDLARHPADFTTVEPPFYQKQSDSSNEELYPGRFPPALSARQAHMLRPTIGAQSSSADDYRSVIDDLTVENKRLKDELKRYKQFGPDPLRKDKLFEIKFHGLPKKKKRELELTLRDFASSLEGSTTSSQQRKKTPNNVKRLQGSSSNSNSKHASSSSSHSRPLDSAYASMSTGPSSSGRNASSAGRLSLGRGRSYGDQKVESYLQDIPEGLFPRQRALTDKDKKKLVVRRLEQLFTGKIGGRNNAFRRHESDAPTRLLEPQISFGGVISAPPLLNTQPVSSIQHLDEPSREARILLHGSDKKNNSREELWVSNSNCEGDAGENNRTGSGSNEYSGHNNSPLNVDLPEQRATRPLDLDPDRIQDPSDNMQYIRHLGVTAPDYLANTKFRSQDVSMDADGWIHLNLLCNLAQLHILNVTPDYIRAAVTERSTKFQLSRDGRKIRWRGGTEGTKFSSESSGGSSQRSPETEVTDEGQNDRQSKRQKTSPQASTPSSKIQSKFGTDAFAHSETFHYKPMFAHQSSSIETSMDGTVSQVSFAAVENSNLNSRSTEFVSGSGSSPQKKRRRDGAIIYYTGAPFCLDLSGDSGDISPATNMVSSGLRQESPQSAEEEMPQFVRTASGSSLDYRPLIDGPDKLGLDVGEEPEYVVNDTDMSDIKDHGFCWCEDPEKPQLRPLEAYFEPCGLGGVTPEDHFALLVVTRHPIKRGRTSRLASHNPRDLTAALSNRIVGSKTSSSCTPNRFAGGSPLIQIQMLQQRYKSLKPLPLPPPAIFYPPFTETTESDDSGFEEDYADEENDSDIIVGDSDEAISQQANPHQSDNELARMRGLDSDEEDDVFDVANLPPKVSFARRLSRPFSQHPSGSFGKSAEMHPDSSGATVGEASGYSSGREDS